ncbi:hypothetical protein ACVBEG_13750 [Pseudomonas sp. GG8]
MKEAIIIDINPTALPDSPFIKILGEPQRISIDLSSVDHHGPNIAENFDIEHSTMARYKAADVMISTSKGHVLSKFILYSMIIGKTCNVLYRFQDNDPVTLNEHNHGIEDLFSQHMDNFESQEEIHSFHDWIIFCIIAKFRETGYFSALHGIEEIPMIAAYAA